MTVLDYDYYFYSKESIDQVQRQKVKISQVNTHSWDIEWNNPDNLMNGIEVNYTVQVIYGGIIIWDRVTYNNNSIRVTQSDIKKFLCLPLTLNITAKSYTLSSGPVSISQFQFPKGMITESHFLT